jgi:hypothetical protein
MVRDFIRYEKQVETACRRPRFAPQREICVERASDGPPIPVFCFSNNRCEILVIVMHEFIQHSCTGNEMETLGETVRRLMS